MELKPGYKQTEVGVIPEEWDVESLERISDPKRTICYGIVQVGQFASNGIGVLAIKNLNGDYTTNIHRCSREIEIPYIRSRVQPGDILVSIKGTIGRVGLVPQHYVGNISRDLARISLTDSDVPEFWHQLLQSQPAQRLLQLTTVGTTRLELSIGPLKKVTMPRPPKPEQRAIATALRDVDTLREALDRLTAKKRDLKQAAMQQLLTGKTRIYGFHSEWEVKRLGDVASVSKGTQLHSSEAEEGGRFAHLNGGIAPSSYTHKSNTPGNTIAISEGGNSCGFVQFMTEPYWCGGHCYSVIPKGVDNDFLFQALKGQQCAIMGLRVGSGLPNIQKTALLGFKIRLPSGLPEQTAIAAVLTDMDAEIDALEQRRAKTANLKQALMQELLTGKTRLVGPQVSDEEVQAASGTKGHNWAINEAVVIAMLVKHFGKEDYPLGRKRYTKLSYLLHRHVERKADGYLKKAAGPYNPQTKYGGPEKIAKQNGYIREHKGPKGHSGFIAADKVAQAEGYFEKWYGPEVIQWLEQFRYKTNDDLEVLATVDMAAVELRASGKTVYVAAVKDVIASHPEWEAKLDRAAFSDANIAEAINQSEALMGSETAGGSHA